jgi:hypothetical protein
VRGNNSELLAKQGFCGTPRHTDDSNLWFMAGRISFRQHFAVAALPVTFWSKSAKTAA